MHIMTSGLRNFSYHGFQKYFISEKYIFSHPVFTMMLQGKPWLLQSLRRHPRWWLLSWYPLSDLPLKKTPVLLPFESYPSQSTFSYVLVCFSLLQLAIIISFPWALIVSFLNLDSYCYKKILFLYYNI